jgi:serine/threonine-protein kinase
MRPVYASDIYAVGVTCIYLLTGKSPKDLDYNPLTGEMLWQQKFRSVTT